MEVHPHCRLRPRALSRDRRGVEVVDVPEEDTTGLHTREGRTAAQNASSLTGGSSTNDAVPPASVPVRRPRAPSPAPRSGAVEHDPRTNATRCVIAADHVPFPIRDEERVL